MKERSVVLLQPLNLAHRGGCSGAVSVIVSGRGRERIDAISVRAKGFLDQEHALQTMRQDAAAKRLRSGKRLAILGAIAIRDWPITFSGNEATRRRRELILAMAMMVG